MILEHNAAKVRADTNKVGETRAAPDRSERESSAMVKVRMVE